LYLGIQDHLKQIIIMDNGYQYFKKIFILPHVKFWWMDEKWCQHDILVLIVGELHSSWKKLLRQSCNWVIMSCTIYTMSCRCPMQLKTWVVMPVAKHPFFHSEKYIERLSCRFGNLENVKLQNVLKLGNKGLSGERHGQKCL
jgi:hypothetical protein